MPSSGWRGCSGRRSGCSEGGGGRHSVPPPAPAGEHPPAVAERVKAIDSSPVPIPRCCGGRGIVRPTASACARRRQGASLRSAPASRGSRPGRRLRARLSRPGIYRTMPNPDPLHLVVDNLSRLTHFRATVDTAATRAGRGRDQAEVPSRLDAGRADESRRRGVGRRGDEALPDEWMKAAARAGGTCSLTCIENLKGGQKRRAIENIVRFLDANPDLGIGSYFHRDGVSGHGACSGLRGSDVRSWSVE